MAKSRGSKVFPPVVGIAFVIALVGIGIYNEFTGKHPKDEASASSRQAEQAAKAPPISEPPPATADATEPDSDLEKYLPAHKDGDMIVRHRYYVLKFDPSHNTASWTIYRSTRTHLGNRTAKRNNMRFKPDPLLGELSPHTEDYIDSHYDRGHLVPCRDMAFNVDAMAETFLMSNMTPQHHDFNGGIWEEVEEMARELTQKNKTLVIVTGPVYDATAHKQIGKTKAIDVPEEFYKIVFKDQEGQRFMAAFIVPHQTFPDKNPDDFQTTVDEIENRTGIDFFPGLTDEAKLESQKFNLQFSSTKQGPKKK